MNAIPSGDAPQSLGPEEKRLLGEITRAIRGSPDAFRPGGRRLDEEYSQKRVRAKAVWQVRYLRTESQGQVQIHRGIALLFAHPGWTEEKIAKKVRCDVSTLRHSGLWQIAHDFSRHHEAPLDLDGFSAFAIDRGTVVPLALVDALKAVNRRSDRSARRDAAKLVQRLIPWHYQPIVQSEMATWRATLAQAETPWARLQTATYELAGYEPPYAVDSALAICVVAWIQWDAEAHKSGLNLCEFEALPWEWEYRPGEPLDGREMATAVQPRYGGGAIIQAAWDAVEYLRGLDAWPSPNPSSPPSSEHLRSELKAGKVQRATPTHSIPMGKGNSKLSADANENREAPSRDGLGEAIDLLLSRIDTSTVSMPEGGRRIDTAFGAEAVNRALDELYRHPYVTYCDNALNGEMLLDELDPLYADAVLALLTGTLAGCGEPFGYDQGAVIPAETLERLRAARAVLGVAPSVQVLKDPPAQDQVEALVGLDQAAVLAGVSKKTLERMKERGELPEPHRPGGGGQAALWRWAELRAAIQPRARRILPERFPAQPE